MGKMFNILIMVFVIELSLYLFAATDYASTTLFALLLHPAEYLSNELWVKITAVASIAGIGGIIAGSIFSSRIEFAVYLTMVSVFLTFALPLANLWQTVYGGLSGGLTAEVSLILTALMVVPLFLYFTISALEWARSNQ